MQATLPAVLGDQESSDVHMDIDSSLPGSVHPASPKRSSTPKRALGGVKTVLEVEILTHSRGSSRTPVRNVGQLLATPAKSPGLRRSPRPQGHLVAKTPTKSVKSVSRTPAPTPPNLTSIKPASSVLSDVSTRSPLRESQRAPEIPVTGEQLDRLQDLCKDVFVKYSDGPDIPRLDLPGSATPRHVPTSLSSISKALGTRDLLITPRSQRSTDMFSDGSPRLSVPSSLPHNLHHEVYTVRSPSKRASMMRTWSGRPMPNSVHAMRHQNVLPNAAGKRKVSGAPIAEEPRRMESPVKRQHLSPPEKPKSTSPTTSKPRARPKPVFATSSPRNLQINAAPPLPVSPARSTITNPGSAPTTPFKSGSGIFTHPSTAQGSPIQEYDTDKSYVSSSVMEEKMPMLIPYQRLEPTALSQELFNMDVVEDRVPDVEETTTKAIGTEDVGDESGDDVRCAVVFSLPYVLTVLPLYSLWRCLAISNGRLKNLNLSQSRLR